MAVIVSRKMRNNVIKKVGPHTIEANGNNKSEFCSVCVCLKTVRVNERLL